MKIVLATNEFPGYATGGVGAYIACIAPALSALGHDVHIICCDAGLPDVDDEVDGVHLHVRPAPTVVPARLRRRAPLSAQRVDVASAVARTYRALGLRADVLEQPDWMAAGGWLARRARIPSVANLHTPVGTIMSANDVEVGRDIRLADRIERSAVRAAAVVTSPSSLLTTRLRAGGWLRDEPLLIRLPIDTDRWMACGDADDTEPVVLSVGRLERRKSPETTIEAAALLSDIAGLHVVFVGRSGLGSPRGTYRDWLTERAGELGVRATFIDELPRDELVAWYRRARVVCVPSLFESFSMATVEAMAAGRPVVVSDSVGAGELLAGSDAGARFTTGDAGALAAALRPYLADAAAAGDGGRTARAIVSASCRPDIVAKQREDAYQRAVAS